MDGVVILNEIDAVIGHTWGFNWLAMAYAIAAIMLIVISILYWSKSKRKKHNGYAIFFAIVGIVLSIFSFSSATPITETQYEIFMPGEVNMIEFTEHYEITGQRGLIYTVRDLTNIVIEEVH